MGKPTTPSPNMTPAERHNYIIDALRNQSSIAVIALAEQLKVSEVTIRKDLTILESRNMLYRVHGSAILINPYINNRHVNEKEGLNAEEKRAIGSYAAQLISKDDSILIASGTTMLSLAREITAKGHLTAITAAINVASILSKCNDTDIIQLGGILRNSSVSVVGPHAELMLQNFSCSKMFLGVDGIDLEFGLTTTNMMEANLNRVMISASQKVIVLADWSKFGRRGFSKICDCSNIDQIITDNKTPKHIIERFEDQGIEVSIAN